MVWCVCSFAVSNSIKRDFKWLRTKEQLSKPVLNKAVCLSLKSHLSLLSFYQGKLPDGILKRKWKCSFLLPCSVLNPNILLMNSFPPLDTLEIHSLFFVEIFLKYWLNAWRINGIDLIMDSVQVQMSWKLKYVCVFLSHGDSWMGKSHLMQGFINLLNYVWVCRCYSSPWSNFFFNFKTPDHLWWEC